MRYSFHFYLLLAGTILALSACDDEDVVVDPPPECFPELPFLELSDGDCSPTLYRMTDLNGLPDNAGLNLTPQCTDANDHGRIVRVEIPASGVLTVQVYNATYGYVSLTVFGADDCEENMAPINGCFSTTDVASSLVVAGLNSFDNAYIRIDVSASPPGEPFEGYVAETDQFIGIAAWEKVPQPSTAVPYRGIDKENDLTSLAISCDGRSTQRVIIGSCNAGADLESWREEVGLERSESHSGPGGSTQAVDVPPTLDPNTTIDALAKRRPRQNTADFFAEADFIIRVPVPGDFTGGLYDVNDFTPQQPGEVFTDCLTFELGKASGNNPDDQIVVTMIDSGVDYNDSQTFSYWNNHRNQSASGPFTRPGELGYDFIYADYDPVDEFGHGTNTAGALIGEYDGNFPLTVIHNKIFSVTDDYGVFATYFGAVVAVQVAVEAGSDIINASWGLSPEEEPQALRCAVDYALQKGTVIITSSGNDSLDIGTAPQWPAAFSFDFANVVTVGSWMYPNGIESDPARPAFANFNGVYAQVSAYLTAKTPRFKIGGFNYLVGTSISTPLVTGTFAEQYDPTVGTATGFLSRFAMSGSLTGAYANGNYLPVCPDLLDD